MSLYRLFPRLLNLLIGGSLSLVLANGSDLEIRKIGGWTNVSGATAISIGVRLPHAFIANGRGGLQILDLSNPAAPVSVGAIPFPAAALAVAVSGDYAYVANTTNGLVV